MSTFIEVCCPNEDCPRFSDSLKFAKSDFYNQGKGTVCSQCQTNLIPLSELPDPNKKNYSLKKDMDSPPSGAFKKSTLKNVEEWAESLKISKDEFRKKIKDGDYDKWFEEEK